MLFLSSTHQTSFHPRFVQKLSRFSGKAVIRKGKLKLPRKAIGYFTDGAELELIGMGDSFMLREPNGKIYWNTWPDGKITLVSVGKKPCGLALQFNENNMPLDRSSFPFGKLPGVFRHLLCGFEADTVSFKNSPNMLLLSLGKTPTTNLSQETENNLCVTLRHTGLPLVFTDLAASSKVVYLSGKLTGFMTNITPAIFN